MVYSIDEIKKDLENLTEKQFYTKHIIRSDNWYFEKYLGRSPSDIIHLTDDYRLIISESFGISFNSVMMVGSGKIGFSLSPVGSKDDKSKLFLPFNDDENIRKISDLDIAIISSDIFHKFWKLFRKSYKTVYQNTYNHIFNEIYRGYINERNIIEIENCRKEWNKMAFMSKKNIKENLYFKHEISYRIYRSWEDFEDYNLQNIRKIKRMGL